MSKYPVNAVVGGAMSRLPVRLVRSALALGIALALPAGVLHAQNTGAQADAERTDDATDSAEAVQLESVQVKGVRGSLMRAQELKQDASQIVDSVTAQDIGALPDRSVTETLKRVSGVTVTNFLARDDPDHFSAEGSGVMVRGLTQVRGELNGRDIFSANGGRGLSFEEVPAELMAGVDVYKNPSADIIEGGLGGTVNLRTRMPFDSEGRRMAASLDYNYGDHVKEGKPSGSFLFSDRWTTSGGGEFGALINLSYSELATRSDGIQVAPYARRGATYAPADFNDPNSPWTEVLLGDSGFDQVFVPGGINWRTLDFERKRQGIAAAMQWRPNDDTEIYTQYLRSEYDMQWRERAMFLSDEFDMANGDGKSNSIVPMPGTQFTYDENGVFQSGIVRSGNYPWHATMTGGGVAFNTDNRLSRQKTVTSDWSVGFRHYMTDNLVMRGDFQAVDSYSKPIDFTVFTAINMPGVTMDVSGKYPQVSLGDPDYVLDPANYYWRAAMDHLEDNTGDQLSGRLDWEYTFDDNSWLKFVRFGTRITSREQVNKNSGWNWGVVSDSWAEIPNPSGNNVATLNSFLTDRSELHSLGNFWRGKVNVPTELWYPKDGIVDIDTAAKELGAIIALRGWGWAPDSFQPQDTNTQEERTQAAYAVAYFENEEALGVPVDGNIGIRVVQTSTRTDGYGQMPDLRNNGAVTQEVRDKFNGSYFANNFAGTYTDVLPSLNIRTRFTEQLQWRIAASKAIARPDFRQMQAWLPLSVAVDSQCQAACDFDDLNSFEGSAGNPALNPMEANQFDTALEWYFGTTNMLYTTLFYKDVKGYFATQTRPETIDGDVYQITRPYNLDKGKIQGFEVGYNQFFDFLPGWLKGFGVQANYTYVDSSGGANTIADPNDVAARTALVELPLEGLSKNSYNVVGIYETGPWSIRLAYNWRSRYLLTSSDVSTRLPTWADDYGQLDGSFFYSINKNVQIGLQANNLTDSITTVLMGPHYYPSDGYKDERLYVRGQFMNDRRYSAVLRASW